MKCENTNLSRRCDFGITKPFQEQNQREKKTVNSIEFYLVRINTGLSQILRKAKRAPPPQKHVYGAGPSKNGAFKRVKGYFY